MSAPHVILVVIISFLIGVAFCFDVLTGWSDDVVEDGQTRMMADNQEAMEASVRMRETANRHRWTPPSSTDSS